MRAGSALDLKTARQGVGNVRKLRLASGLVLFAYVASHLANHATGNISVEAMEAGLRGMKAVWQSIPGTIVLYAAFLLHGALGFRALYERRVFRLGTAEVAQLILGLTIPLVLLLHIANTRIAFAVTGFSKAYAQELYSFWIGDPRLGAAQVVMLIVAWAHGCLGLYFWLRLKPAFRRISLWLLGLAVLWPTLALLGFYQGGRTILALAQDDGWRGANLTAIEVGTLAEQAWIALIRNVLVVSYVAGILGVLAARWLRTLRESSRGLISLHYPERKTIKVPQGLSLLEASTRYEMPHAGVCGGRARCGTCLVTVLSGLDHCPPPNVAEAEMLTKLRTTDRPARRLGCQLRPTGDITFVPMLPPHAGVTFAFGGGRRIRSGRRRYVVCLFAELRDIGAVETGLAPGDLLFVTNCFLAAAAQSVTEAGGEPNTISGKGLLGLFGLTADPATACRQAIEASALLSANVGHLNSLVMPITKDPVRFVVGLHGGEAMLGEIGLRDELAFTAVGGVVRDAAVLTDAARLSRCEAILSEEVCALAGVRHGVLNEGEVAVPGETRTIEVRSAEQAVQVFAALDAIIDDAVRAIDPPGSAHLAPA